MPNFDYLCNKCGYTGEYKVAQASEVVSCPTCGNGLEKLFPAFHIGPSSGGQSSNIKNDPNKPVVLNGREIAQHKFRLAGGLNLRVKLIECEGKPIIGKKCQLN